MTINPNWPVIEHGWGAHWNCNGGDSPLDRYVDVTWRTRGQVSIQRGRQYELDQVRAGTTDLSLVNNDSALDPSNTAGPYYGHVMPYQPYRIRAQWPPTINLLTQTQATGGDLGGQPLGTINGGNSGPSIFSSTDSTGGAFTASATAWQGTTVMQFAVTTAAGVPTSIVYTPQPAVQPGTTYTNSVQVRNVTASTTIQVAAGIRWLDTGQNFISTSTGTAVTLTGSTTAAWTQITVTGTAPANAAMMYISVLVTAVPAANCSVQVDGWQLERNGSASTWVQPGVWYPISAGFVERWPSTWALSGTYGTVQPTTVDAFSLLSQRVLRDPLTEEIYSRAPRFLYTLGDPQNAAAFTDAIGAYPPAPLAVSKYGAGTLTSGNQITSATTGGTYTGSSGTVVTVTNPNPGTNTVGPATFISLGTVGIAGPAAPTVAWTRMIAFRYTAGTPSSSAIMWSSLSNVSGGSLWHFSINSSGQFTVTLSGPAMSFVVVFPVTTASVADGNWHLALASYSHANAQLIVNLDGSSTIWGSMLPAWEPTGLISDNIGGFVDPTAGNGTSWNFQGDLSYAAEFPTALSSAAMTSVYSAWKSSFAGDSSNTRYQRILNWAGYIGPQVIQTGLTTSMGPANVDGQDALSALQAVVDTENGEHFVDRMGNVTFRARSARYNSLTPAFTFGENSGEIPYEDLGLDYDPTHLANQVSVTQDSTGQIFTAQDATSITNYFPRQLARTINSANTQECQDAANYLCSRYKNPAVRISSLKLHPSANPTVLWPVCLSLELGTRIRVMRRPPAPATAIEADCFIESINWTFDDQGEAWATLQCSPVDSTPYGIFSAFHATLSGSPAAGVTSVTINAGADNTNPASTQLGTGQQVILGLGTANQETVTINSVGATSSGWTTAVITLQSATTKSHTVGDTVCEPLPSGVTSASTYDMSAQFDSTAFAY